MACGGESSGGTSGSTGGNGVDLADVELDRDAELTTTLSVLSRWDPHRSVQSHDLDVLATVYDRLVHLEPDGTFVPGLATEWAFSDDGLTLTLNLREGVEFHDGSAFDAEVVKANLERAKTVEGSTAVGSLASIDTVEVVDPLTVALHLSRPDAGLVGILSDRPGMMISPEGLTADDLDAVPAGSGMYEVTDYRPNDRIVLERFDGYWDPDAAGVRRLTMLTMQDEQARLNALQTGELDITTVSPATIDAADALDGFTVHPQSGLTFRFLQLNRARSEFGDVRVRQAMNFAIDRQAIADGLFFGYAVPTVQPFPEGYWAHSPEAEDAYPHDPDEARDLLAEAGLPDGFEFELIIPSGAAEVTTLAEAVQEQLAEVGITMKLRPVEGAQLAEIFYARAEGDALMSEWGGRHDPSTTVGLRYTSDGFSNPGRHTTDELMELYDESLATSDQAEREPILQQISDEVVDQVLDIPLVFQEVGWVTRDDVVGFEPNMLGRVEFRGVGVPVAG